MARKVGTRHGLTCGYWSNRPSDCDTHVMQEHVRHLNSGTEHDDIYDLMPDQWQGQPLHRCQYSLVDDVARRLSSLTPTQWVEWKKTYPGPTKTYLNLAADIVHQVNQFNGEKSYLE